jgi:hypothetical protein
MSIFLFSEIEIFGTNTESFTGEGTQYPIFTNAASRVKRLSNGTGGASIWWGVLLLQASQAHLPQPTIRADLPTQQAIRIAVFALGSAFNSQ